MKTFQFSIEEEDELIFDTLGEMFPQIPPRELTEAILSTHTLPRQSIRIRYQESIRELVGDLSQRCA